MKKSRFPQLISFVLLSLVIHEATAQNNIPIAPLLLDSGTLATTKSQLEQEEPRLQKAYAQLILAADKALLEGPFSVTDKSQLPPSGNKNDYASYSRYWWPDPTKADGLPYRRMEKPIPGVIPPAKNMRLDHRSLRFSLLFTAAKFNYGCGFLDAHEPNLTMPTQTRDGLKISVLDGRIMIRALEASLLIEGSKALSKEEKQGLKGWAEAYFEWLTSSELALQEAASKNNHGSYYDLQALYFALYAGKKEQAVQIAQNFYTKRILKQIQKDGSMPEEMARTRPLFYSIYNLNALFLVAHLAEKVAVDIWKKNISSSRLRTALDYLAPYSNPDKSWPHPTLRATNRMDLFQILQLADRVYPTGNYLDFARQLPKEDLEVERSLLAYPLMR